MPNGHHRSESFDAPPAQSAIGSSGPPVDRVWVLSRRDVCAVAAGSVALVVASGWRFRYGWAWPPYATGLIGVLVLCAIDARSWRLPREIVYTTTITAGGLLLLASWQLHRFDDLRTAAVAAVMVWVGFKVLTVIARRRGGVLGDGDVRFGAMCAGLVGWLDGRLVLVWLCTGFGCAAASGLYRRHRHGTVRSPFGPPLGITLAIVVLWSAPLVRWLFTV